MTEPSRTVFLRVWQDIALALARQIGDDPGAAEAALRTLIEKHGASFGYHVAEVYALRNTADKTFECQSAP